MYMENLKNDAESRELIIKETGKNFFVEAGAGSGKTTMLVNRMVAMVESKDDIDISKICAITFTKAAASEFYERFQAILMERSSESYDWEDKGYEGQLPKAKGRKFFECDANYTGGKRGAERIVYSSDGRVWYTKDHYGTFEELFPSD
jgi:Rad3-related DNA helicase